MQNSFNDNRMDNPLYESLVMTRKRAICSLRTVKKRPSALPSHSACAEILLEISSRIRSLRHA